MTATRVPTVVGREEEAAEALRDPAQASVVFPQRMTWIEHTATVTEVGCSKRWRPSSIPRALQRHTPTRSVLLQSSTFPIPSPHQLHPQQIVHRRHDVPTTRHINVIVHHMGRVDWALPWTPRPGELGRDLVPSTQWWSHARATAVWVWGVGVAMS